MVTTELTLLEDRLIQASLRPNAAWTFARDLVGDAVPLLSQPALSPHNQGKV